MNYFGTTVYDPLEGSSTSIDPLNSLAVSVQLAEMVFPGSSGRIWKPRYLSALCFLIDCAETTQAQSFKENYLDFRFYENAFIISCTLLQKKDDPGLSGFMGSQKALNLIENTPRGILDLTGDILSNQANLGPLGVHQVLLRNLGLIEEDNLVLTQAGKDLALCYRKNLGEDANKIQEAGNKKRAHLEKLQNIKAETFNFNFALNGKSESELIAGLLMENERRKCVFKDVKKISLHGEYDSETEFIGALPGIKESTNQLYYELIQNFDNFQKYLHWAFYHFLEGEFKGERSLSDFERFKNNFNAIAGNLNRFADRFKVVAENITSIERIELRQFLDFLERVQSTLSSPEDFSDLLVLQHHMNHQKSKNKAPWVNMKAGNILPTVRNMIKTDVLDSTLESRIHRYRYSNAFNMLRDLDGFK